MSLIRVVVSGTLESDPERRFTNNNIAVTNFMLAMPAIGLVNSRNPVHLQEPVRLKVVCWRTLADQAAEQLRKGAAVCIEGRLIGTSGTAPDGSARKGFELEAQSLHLLGGAILASLSGQPSAAAATGGNAATGEGSSSGSGAYAQAPGATANVGMPQAMAVAAAAAPAARRAPVATEPEGGSLQELLTEDDIPF
jgi:single-stranded DNA-binding protein